MEVEVRARSEEGHLARPTGAPRTLGRYRLVTELGRGSTSIVYLAAVDGPGGFNKLFALKRLRPALADNPTFVRMFLAEARVGARLDHPNVVSTLEIDETDALPYIVMEYLDGQPLQKLLATAAAAFLHLPHHMHLAALSGALEGLTHAHAANEADGTPLQIVHRDVSPHNVFVTSTGTAKLLDFGCAQTAGAPWTIPTSAGHAAYMSPEQASGRPVDARSDLFSMGVMLWEAVARRRFWPDTATKADILSALASETLPTTRVTGLANAPEDLRAIVFQATAPRAAERYAHAAALQADLQKALRRLTPPAFELRELGHRLTTVFASERARLQTIVNEQQAATRRAPVSSPPPPQIVSLLPKPAAAPDPGPLPSFPLPDLDRPERRAQRATWTIVALAASALVGAAASTVHTKPTEAPRPIAPAATATLPAAMATASNPPLPSASAVLEAPLAPVASASETALPPPRRTPALIAARSHAPAPPPPLRVPESPPVAGRPSHPIDSVNPYGP
jgi:serine/threonine-protein kinase